MNVASGARMFLLYISAQISYPPSIHKFLFMEVRHTAEAAIRTKKQTKINIKFLMNSPQRSGSFDDDLFLGVRESTDQRSDDVFALQETPRRGVVVNQV